MRLESRHAALLLWAGLLVLPSWAWAQPAGAILALHFQDTGERRVVVAASERGLVFIGEDLGNFRAFRSQALSGERPFFWFEDVDGSRGEECVFAGDPSFVLAPGGDPLFGVLDGCEDFYLGNIVGDDVMEVFCRRRSTLTVWNYDGQFLWEYAVTGMRISGCSADDVDGDERLEFGCSAGGDWLLVDIENAEPVQDAVGDPVEMVPEDPRRAWARETTAALSGERTFDLDGDGRAQETLLFNAGNLTMLDATGTTLGSVSLPSDEVYSVEVADLNRDGTPEVFLGGVNRIDVVSPGGEILARVEGNPNALDRDARVTIESATANGLEDSSADTIRATLEGEMGRIQRCYSRQMGSDQFVRVGSMFHELSVDGQGRVTNVQKIHSSVANRDLEGCVEDVLEDLRFTPATADRGTASIRLGFDFVDR